MAEESMAEEDSGVLSWYRVDQVADQHATLKESKLVRAKIQEFWEVLDVVKTPEGEVEQKIFVEMNIKFQKALNPSHDEEEAMKSAMEDWERDCEGKLALNLGRF